MVRKYTGGLLPALLAAAFGVVMLGAPPASAQEAAATAPAQDENPCLACHDAAAEAVDAKFQLSATAWAASTHGAAGLGCDTCHAGNTEEIPHQLGDPWATCKDCHEDAVNLFNESVHAKAAAAKGGPKINCASCHGNLHDVRSTSDPKSALAQNHIAKTCGKCHGQKLVMEPAGFSTRPFFSYQESVHGRAVAGGSTQAAVCTDCHNSHDVRPANDPKSPIFTFNIPQTCGKCHGKVTNEFMSSVHGQAVQRGNSKSPVCTDCHGIHDIKPHIDPKSSVSNQAVARTTCAQCHEGVRLTSEFGVAGKRVSSYSDSYHGLAAKMGSPVAANCASCHGVHNIRPSTDPASMIHPKNLVATCGNCHPGATDKFIHGKVHLDIPAAKDPGGIGVRWIRVAYLWIIWLTIGGMVAHNVLIWIRKAVAKRRRGDRVVVRMNRQQRIQHFFLLTSFFVLVFTGFALVWPESWLAQALGSSETVRRMGHRIAAVVMLAVGVYHVFYMTVTREGRQGLRDFLPGIQDARDAMMNVGYYLGLTKTRPHFGRFSYAEKAEYWALVWGTVVMGVTGIMLWAKVWVSQFIPRWWIDIALAIHYYEAILATLAIIVWHIYQVVFDPDTYPMNWAWYDGKMTTEEYRHEHPAAYEAWLREQNRKDDGGDDEPYKVV
ncbi:MAG: cytochrome b/b6 domain-containing protein [Thermoanaerobaculia bacterium]